MKGRMRPYLPELTIRDYNTYQWYQRGVRRQLYTTYGLYSCYGLRYNGVLFAVLADSLAGRPATCKRMREPGTLVWRQMMCQTQGIRLAAQVEALASKPEGFAVLDEAVEEPMKAAIRAAGAEGDSVGGMLETAILGLPAGIGEPYFDSVESEIAHLAFSVPAVKGIEFGTGFGFAGMRGSEANDAFRMTPQGAVVTATNHNAGVNGGIANGMPVVFRTVVKPTPSIYKQQNTVDYLAKKDAQLSIQGRHDPCIVPRAAIVQTCAAALAVGDLLTARYGEAWMTHPTSFRKEDE